jgi:OFA family oxalate/formate antiporter-like MFS transporter
MRDNSFAGTASHLPGPLPLTRDPAPAQSSGRSHPDHESRIAMMAQDTTTTATPRSQIDEVVQSPAFRWGQLILGIICMGLIANLQYGWTLFVNPIEAKNHWGLSAIQLAFSIFVVVETWLVPVEGWLVDRFGPRPVIAAGALMAGAGWVLNAYADSLPLLYFAAVVSGLGAGCVYGTCVGNALKWFPD